jgi:hypothetical protein
VESGRTALQDEDGMISLNERLLVEMSSTQELVFSCFQEEAQRFIADGFYDERRVVYNG